jgi:hypothetical protein
LVNKNIFFCFVLEIKIFILFRYGVALYYPPGNFPNQYAENVQQRSDLEDNRLA